MNNYSYLVLVSLLVANTCYADTTTTTTDDNGNVTTEEMTTKDSDDDPNLIGPAGATGTIRRSDRRQDRRDGDAHIDRR